GSASYPCGSWDEWWMPTISSVPARSRLASAPSAQVSSTTGAADTPTSRSRSQGSPLATCGRGRMWRRGRERRAASDTAARTDASVGGRTCTVFAQAAFGRRSGARARSADGERATLSVTAVSYSRAGRPNGPRPGEHMDVFEVREQLVSDYRSFTAAFVEPRDER